MRTTSANMHEFTKYIYIYPRVYENIMYGSMMRDGGSEFNDITLESTTPCVILQQRNIRRME